LTFAFISVAASLLLLLALNWQRFRAMGGQSVTRMLLIWVAIILGLGLGLRLLGF
jgi:hypothetical protein